MMICVILVSTWSVDHEYEEDSSQTFRVNIQVSEILVILNGVVFWNVCKALLRDVMGMFAQLYKVTKIVEFF